MPLRKVKMSRAHGPALEWLSSFTSRLGAFLALTSSFPRMLESVGLHGVEGVGRVSESLSGEMLFELAQKVVALSCRCKLNGDAAFVVRRYRGRGAKLAAAQSAQPGQRAPAELVHHGCCTA